MRRIYLSPHDRSLYAIRDVVSRRDCRAVSRWYSSQIYGATPHARRLGVWIIEGDDGSMPLQALKSLHAQAKIVTEVTKRLHGQ